MDNAVKLLKEERTVINIKNIIRITNIWRNLY